MNRSNRYNRNRTNRTNRTRTKTRYNSNRTKNRSRNNRRLSRKFSEINYNESSNRTDRTTYRSKNYHEVQKTINTNKRIMDNYKNIDCDVSYFGCIYPCVWDSSKIREGKCSKISEDNYRKKHIKHKHKHKSNTYDTQDETNLIDTKQGREKLLNHHRKYINMINDKNRSEYEKLKSKKLEIVELLKKLAVKDKDYSYKIQQNPKNIEELIEEWGYIRDEFKSLEREMDDIDLKLIHYKKN